MATQILKINSIDNVAVAIVELHVGEQLQVDGKAIVVKEVISAGHKVALQPLSVNDLIIKYG
ncbi:MAG: altronate dehydratase, partial [Microbacter sp.]